MSESEPQCDEVTEIPLTDRARIRLVIRSGIPEVVRCGMARGHYVSRGEGHAALLGPLPPRPGPDRLSLAGPPVTTTTDEVLWYRWSRAGDLDQPRDEAGTQVARRCSRLAGECALPARHRGACMPLPPSQAVRDLGPLHPQGDPPDAPDPDACPAPPRLITLTPQEKLALWARAHFPLDNLAAGSLVPLGRLEIEYLLDAARRKLWHAPGLPAAVAIALATSALPRPPMQRKGPVTLTPPQRLTLTAILLGEDITDAARGRLWKALRLPKQADDCRAVWTAYATGALVRKHILDLLYPDGRPHERPRPARQRNPHL
ncbi:hypothetical protein [Streptomyces sp. GZWMJZ-114]|uniref:hypothetical protein n=1 Tax=Streptomyces sp. GZWMJZ-114 TaxID=2494734 RepID=UPI001011495C|nr:hypothetical protein [Streptomyces sp. GZWMJZ-114]